MKRPLLNLLTALSLLPCMAVIVLWAWGGILYIGHRPQWNVTAERGKLVAAPSDGSGHGLDLHMPAVVAILFCLIVPAVALQRRLEQTGARTRLWLLPLFYGLAALHGWSDGWLGNPLLSWSIGVPLAIVVWTAAREGWLEHQLRKNISRGLCADCGYDLRATPGRCPECGTAATAPA